MGGLNTTLSIGMQALDAAQGALDVTSHNIANANTPGYSKELVQLSASAIAESGGDVSGGGVSLNGIQSVRNQLLDLQIQQQTSLQSSTNTQSANLQQIQTFFTTTGTDVASALTTLSGSLVALSASPSNSTTQQAVLASGKNLARAFNTTATGLTSAQTSADGFVTESVAQINTLAQQIAALNGQVAKLTASGQNDGSVQDQLNQSVQQLSQLTGISITQSSDGETITTANGTPLVMGSQSFSLQTTMGSNGFQQVLDSNGSNITGTLQGGQLGGAIQARDQTVPGFLLQLNTLATQVATTFNAAQAAGMDSNSNPGQNVFTIPTNLANAASGIGVAITNPGLIATSSVGSPNGNGNVSNLSAALTITLPSNSAISTAGTTALPLGPATALTNGSITSFADSSTGKIFSFTAGASSTIGSLQAAIAGAVSAGTLSAGTTLSINSNGQAVISTTTAGDILQVSTNDAALGQFDSTSGKTAASAYASLVFDVGNQASDASTQSTAIGQNLLQLTNQLGSASGVNINDETANLIRFQTAYQAAARIVSTIQQLYSTTINMIS
jgi:flagellar hook-associated protein 1 FlgK